MFMVAPDSGVITISARYRALIRIAQAIRGNRNPKELFHLLTRELREVLPFDGIVQFDEAAQKVHWHHCSDHAHPHPGSLVIAPEDTVAWWVFHNQQAVLVRDAESETRFPENMAMFQRFGVLSACVVPLTTAHRRLGSLAIASESADTYSDEDVLFFSLVADQIALATDDALNFEASQRNGERLQLLLDLSNRVMSNLELPELLKEISASIRQVMQCDGVGVILPGKEQEGFQLYALDFPKSKGILAERVSMPVDETASLTQVIRSRAPLVMNQREIASDYHGNSVAIEEGIQAACHLPLIGKNRVLGVLSLGRLDDVPFTVDDVEFLTQVSNQVAIAIQNALAYAKIAELKDRLAQEKVYLENEIRSELKFEEIIGKSAVLRSVLSQIETVAPTDSTVLIYGDTGTGKELVARALHNLSSRGKNAFVKLNCAAIPTGLLESELFGHERGAFTGAISQRIGRFELAQSGTVFLDEIGEIPLELQPKLLRVLQEREFERLGGTRTIRSDARLIAATNRDLSAMVEEQKFREDLFYRLNVFPIRVPPLRERTEDIPLLVRHFVQQFSRRMNKRIDSIASDTMKALVRYEWPGNIRELQNVIERAVILSPGPALKVSLADLKSRPEPIAVRSVKTPEPGSTMQSVLHETERVQILRALDQAKGIVSGPEGAAALLGMKRSTLQSRMQKLGIRVSRTSSV
ncbi:MAG TPA: sigma 54-interacting transcriptional regulator [Bryobacteraceae bacterium]|jgi:formate hydrogenlyase transcriptional activator|nr:sigma 54-interacting transcriptional regulator [Bryobacteraceae bacterium]